MQVDADTDITHTHTHTRTGTNSRSRLFLPLCSPLSFFLSLSLSLSLAHSINRFLNLSITIFLSFLPLSFHLHFPTSYFLILLTLSLAYYLPLSNPLFWHKLWNPYFWFIVQTHWQNISIPSQKCSVSPFKSNLKYSRNVTSSDRKLPNTQHVYVASLNFREREKNSRKKYFDEILNQFLVSASFSRWDK
jgi:hypothetical protein